jgi:fructokinase
MTEECHNLLVGAIEAGGTKFVCAVGAGPHDLVRATFPTGNDPEQVLSAVTCWLTDQQRQRGTLRAIGVASFGPLDLSSDSPTYGHITSTPKPGWRNTDIVGPLRRAFPGIPVGFDTDVNGAALGEYRWGNGVGLTDFVYITIGTGIGAGAMVGGQLLHGLVHPEMGHMLLPRVPEDTFAGVCPYHGACWEGLCSGPALLKRTGMPGARGPPPSSSRPTTRPGSWRRSTSPPRWPTWCAHSRRSGSSWAAACVRPASSVRSAFSR